MSERPELKVSDLFMVQENLRLEQERTIADLQARLATLSCVSAGCPSCHSRYKGRILDSCELERLYAIEKAARGVMGYLHRFWLDELEKALGSTGQ